jgi:phosphatidylserine/phosphatidylglycerophosphate/cardiolipin synthase-like enzyme
MRLPGETVEAARERIVWGDAALPLNDNRRLLGALQRAKIDVKADLNPAIFHQKFAVRDVRETGAAVLTGSANFTGTDCHTNLNHVLVFDDHDVEMEFAREFAEIWGGEFGRGRIGKPPKTHGVDGVPVKVLFAPDHGPEAEVVKQLLKCPKGDRIDGAMFTFAGSSAIDDAMIVLAGAERTIRVVLDRGQSSESQTWSAARWLQEGGVDVLVPRRRKGLRKLHHKLCVVAGSTVVAGSFNYTEPATLFNDEALLVIGSPHPESEGVDVDAAACEAIAGFFRAEIDRIAAASDPWPAN